MAGKVYKLTNANDQTYDDCQWGEGVTHEARGEGPLCSSDWIYCYDHALLGLLMNPIHGRFKNPHLWECTYSGKTLDDDGLKRGVQKLTTVRRLELPKLTTEQRVRFGILCALQVCMNKAWRSWATKWLDGSDRSREAAVAAKTEMWLGEREGWAVETAAWAAEAAVRAATAMRKTAETAARAAETATRATRTIDLVGLAEQAIREEQMLAREK